MSGKKKRRKRPKPPVGEHVHVVRDFLEVGVGEFVALPERFVEELSNEAHADRFAFNNFVNLSVRAPGNLRNAVEEIAKGAARPIPINSLSTALDKIPFSRGMVFFDHLWTVIDDLSRNFDDMFWWFSENGLSMEVLNPAELSRKIAVKQLTPFEQIAGRLFQERMIKGTVSDEALLDIVRELDGAHFPLKENLRPSDWRKIGEYNQKFSRKAVRTFEEALLVHARGVRRAFSAAKRRYEKAMDI